MGTNGKRWEWPSSFPFLEILQLARQSDEEALSLLYRCFASDVYRYILLRVGDPRDAEDVVSDTFFAMVEGIAITRASDKRSFIAWLLGIARNKAAMHLRKARVRNKENDVAYYRDDASNEMHTVGDEDDPLAVLIAREDWATIAEALTHLTEEQRTALLYHYALGYAIHELAIILNKHPKAIRSLQSRGLASLARHLGLDRVTFHRSTYASEPLPLSGESSHVAQ